MYNFGKFLPEYKFHTHNTNLEHICHSLCSIFMSLILPLLNIYRHIWRKKQLYIFSFIIIDKETTATRSPYLFSFHPLACNASRDSRSQAPGQVTSWKPTWRLVRMGTVRMWFFIDPPFVILNFHQQNT